MEEKKSPLDDTETYIAFRVLLANPNYTYKGLGKKVIREAFKNFIQKHVSIGDIRFAKKEFHSRYGLPSKRKTPEQYEAELSAIFPGMVEAMNDYCC